MKPKIFITRKIPSSALDMLTMACEVDMWEEEDIPVPRNVLEQKVRDVEGLLCLLTEAIDRPLLEQAPHLKVISNMAVGYNNIDVAIQQQSHYGDEYARCAYGDYGGLNFCIINGGLAEGSRSFSIFAEWRMENLVSHAADGTGYIPIDHGDYRAGQNWPSVGKAGKGLRYAGTLL